jgi:hypothetical protein
VELADAAGHHAPDQQLLVGRDGEDGGAGVGRPRLHQYALLQEALDGQLAVQQVMTMSACLASRAAHDQDVAVVESRALHGVAGHVEVIGGGRVRDQQFVQVQVTVQMVVGGQGEAGRDP